MRVPVESGRSKARVVVTAQVPGGSDPRTELQRLRSWAVTRGLHPVYQSSWTLTGGKEFEVRFDIAREGSEIDVHPEERARIQHLPSVHMVRAYLDEAHVDPDLVATKLADWASRYGYEPVGEAEAFVGGQDDRWMEIALPVKRPERADWIEV